MRSRSANLNNTQDKLAFSESVQQLWFHTNCSTSWMTHVHTIPLETRSNPVEIRTVDRQWACDCVDIYALRFSSECTEEKRSGEYTEDGNWCSICTMYGLFSRVNTNTTTSSSFKSPLKSNEFQAKSSERVSLTICCYLYRLQRAERIRWTLDFLECG